jgi:hypothetical protein
VGEESKAPGHLSASTTGTVRSLPLR